jgi:hypothetical protein
MAATVARVTERLESCGVRIEFAELATVSTAAH